MIEYDSLSIDERVNIALDYLSDAWTHKLTAPSKRVLCMQAVHAMNGVDDKESQQVLGEIVLEMTEYLWKPEDRAQLYEVAVQFLNRNHEADNLDFFYRVCEDVADYPELVSYYEGSELGTNLLKTAIDFAYIENMSGECQYSAHQYEERGFLHLSKKGFDVDLVYETFRTAISLYNTMARFNSERAQDELFELSLYLADHAWDEDFDLRKKDTLYSLAYFAMQNVHDTDAHVLLGETIFTDAFCVDSLENRIPLYKLAVSLLEDAPLDTRIDVAARMGIDFERDPFVTRHYLAAGPIEDFLGKLQLEGFVPRWYSA